MNAKKSPLNYLPLNSFQTLTNHVNLILKLEKKPKLMILKEVKILIII